MATHSQSGSVGDPAHGLQLRWALTYYGAYPEYHDSRGVPLLSIYHRLRNKVYYPAISGPLDEADQLQLRSLERIFVERLVQRLRAGSLRGEGRIAGVLSLSRERIPADWWESVSLDLDGNSASSDGVTINSLLIFEDSAEPQGQVEDQSQPRAVYSEDRLRAWFVLRVSGWGQENPFPSESADLRAANEYFGTIVPRGTFRQVRAEKTPAEWRKPGRRRAQ